MAAVEALAQVPALEALAERLVQAAAALAEALARALLAQAAAAPP